MVCPLYVHNDVLFVAGLSLDSSLSLGPQSPLDMKPDTASLLAGSFSPGGPNSPKYVYLHLTPKLYLFMILRQVKVGSFSIFYTVTT